MHGLGVGLGEDRAEQRSDHVLVGLGDQSEQVAGEVDAAALVRRPGEAPGQGLDQPGVLVGDHQAHPPTGPGTLSPARRAVAVLCLVLFVLLFMPTPLAEYG